MLQEARNAWQLQVAKKRTAEQPRILDKAPILPCPAHERSGCSPLFIISTPRSLQEIPFSPCQGNFNGEVGAESGLLLQHQASKTSQSLSFLGPWGRVWDSANQAGVSTDILLLTWGGGCYLTQITLLQTTKQMSSSLVAMNSPMWASESETTERLGDSVGVSGPPQDLPGLNKL